MRYTGAVLSRIFCPMIENVKKGIEGEVVAKKCLESKGYEVLDLNVSYRSIGELDIVAMDGETLVFVEVKARKDDKFGHPLDSVDYKKRKRVVAASGKYLSDHQTLSYKDIRYDVVAILGDDIEHYEDAFYGKWLK